MPNSSQRVRIDLDPVFDIDGTLGKLDQVAGQFNIRVEQRGKTVYTMDLTKCRDYLSSIRRQLEVGERDLRLFIDQDILKYDTWKNCLAGLDPTENILVGIKPLLSGVSEN